MTERETLKVLAVLRAAFPTSYSNMSSGDLQAIVMLWNELLTDENSSDVMEAVKNLILNRDSAFPPSIGEVKAELNRIRSRKEDEYLLESYEANVIRFLPENERKMIDGT